VLDLYQHTEIQVAETRVSQARTDAVRRELHRTRQTAALERKPSTAIRHLGGFPDVIGPLLGRAAAAAKEGHWALMLVHRPRLCQMTLWRPSSNMYRASVCIILGASER
jgi:hypothetical protein